MTTRNLLYLPLCAAALTVGTLAFNHVSCANIARPQVHHVQAPLDAPRAATPLKPAPKGATPSAELAAQIPQLKGRLVLLSMPYSPRVRRKITTWTYLPPGYDDPQNAYKTYPVVYVLHGQPGTWTDCYLSGKVEVMADKLIASGKLPPLILVAFDGSGPGGPRDMTDFTNRTTDDYRVEDFMVQDLVPWVDATYRTVATPSGRALWGYSGGGYGALNVGLKHPDVWGTLCSHAGFYDPADDGKVMRNALGAPGPAWQTNNPLVTAASLAQNTGLHVYMEDSPNAEDYPKFQHLAALLRQHGVDVDTQEHNKAHSWKVIAINCQDSLTFAAQRFAASPADAAPVIVQ